MQDRPSEAWEDSRSRRGRATGHRADGGYAGCPGPKASSIRRIKPMVDQALAQLSPTFDRMYASNGRASIPPEHLRKACLLMALFSVRSERQFCERREYDRLFKWFLDLNIVDRSFDHSVFAKNKQRLLDADVAREQRLLSEEHFGADGTLLAAWASVKSFRPRDGDPPQGIVDAILSWTFMGSGAAMRPIGPPRTRRPGWSIRAKARRRGCFSAPTC